MHSGGTTGETSKIWSIARAIQSGEKSRVGGGPRAMWRKVKCTDGMSKMQWRKVKSRVG